MKTTVGVIVVRPALPPRKSVGYFPKIYVWIRDIQTNELHLIAEELEARPILSPGGNFTVWWMLLSANGFRMTMLLNNQKSHPEYSGKFRMKNDIPLSPAHTESAWGKR